VGEVGRIIVPCLYFLLDEKLPAVHRITQALRPEGKSIGSARRIEEAYFLHFIIQTIHQALHDHPDLPHPTFSAWVKQRHRQIESSELTFLACQLDFSGIFTPLST
jgi:hypothetical protein